MTTVKSLKLLSVTDESEIIDDVVVDGMIVPDTTFNVRWSKSKLSMLIAVNAVELVDTPHDESQTIQLDESESE